MTSALQTAGQLKRSKRSLRNSLRHISRVISNWKIASSKVFCQESSTLSKKLNSFTLTKSWTTWPKQLWFKTNLTFPKTPDTSWLQRVISSWLVASTHTPRSSSKKHTSLTSTDLFWNPSMTCITQELTTSSTSLRTTSTFLEVWHTEMTRTEADHLFRVWTPVSSSPSPARSGSCYPTLRSQDRHSVCVNSMRNIFSSLVESA